MEKWKIIIIMLLLGSLGGYGFYQSQSAQPPQPDPAKTEAQATPAPDPSNQEWIGKTPPAWDTNKIKDWTNSKPMKLSDLKGSVAVIEFWRANCSHCEEAAPFLNAMYQQFKPHGLKMVSFQSPAPTNVNDPSSVEGNWSKVLGFVRAHKLTYPVAFDRDGTLFMKDYKGTLYPTIMVLDKQGIIRYRQTGHDARKAAALQEFLHQLMPEAEHKPHAGEKP